MADHPPDLRRPHLRRREVLAGAAGLAATPVLGGLGAAPARASTPILRAVPGTGERMPAVGMGTWIEFNVGNDPAMLDTRVEILRTFFERGGGMVDSSPMYGTAERVVGQCLARLDDTRNLISATKVWTRWDGEGPEQMAESRRLWGLDTFDVMQIHNLVNWRDHLKTLQAAKEAGKIRYIGVTTSHGRRHDELEAIMREQPIDFVQFTYNIVDRWAEQRLLPLARDKGLGVIVNRPFKRKQLFHMFQDQPLPAWASEAAGAENWAQFFLKFILGHPAVTVAIPATSQVAHMRENMGALTGPLPDAQTRRRMVRYVESL
jgi:diketogulonate reductase-like aldo/keto reductase